MPSPYENFSPAGAALLGLGDLPGAQPGQETEEERRKRLQKQRLASPATRALLGGGMGGLGGIGGY